MIKTTITIDIERSEDCETRRVRLGDKTVYSEILDPTVFEDPSNCLSDSHLMDVVTTLVSDISNK